MANCGRSGQGWVDCKNGKYHELGIFGQIVRCLPLSSLVLQVYCYMVRSCSLRFSCNAFNNRYCLVLLFSLDFITIDCYYGSQFLLECRVDLVPSRSISFTFIRIDVPRLMWVLFFWKTHFALETDTIAFAFEFLWAIFISNQSKRRIFKIVPL